MIPKINNYLPYILAAHSEYAIELSNVDTDYIAVTFKVYHNSAVQTYSNDYHAHNGKLTISLNAILKSIFKVADDFDYTASRDYTIDDNYHFAKLSIQISSIQMNFVVINGVIQTMEQWAYTVDNRIGVAAKMPVFHGYPLSVSILKNNAIQRRLLYDGNLDSSVFAIDESTFIAERIYESGIYIKFLNSKGGYSYWLFDSIHLETIKTKDLGNVSSFPMVQPTARFDFQHLGFSKEKSIELESAVPVASGYIDELTEIETSPEVYVYMAERGSMQNKWLRIKPVSGSGKRIKNKTDVFSFSITIEFPNQKTQSLI